MEPWDYTQDEPGQGRVPAHPPSGRGLAADVWTEPEEDKPVAKQAIDPWPTVLLGQKPAVPKGTDPCSRQFPGRLPKAWTEVERKADDDVKLDPASGDDELNTSANDPVKQGLRDGYQFNASVASADEDEGGANNSARGVGKMIDLYTGRPARSNCSYTFRRKTEPILQSDPYSSVLAVHAQLQVRIEACE